MKTSMYEIRATIPANTVASIDDDLRFVEARSAEEAISIWCDAYREAIEFSLSDHGFDTLSTIVGMGLRPIDLRVTKIPEPRGRSRICCVYDLREDYFSAPEM